MYNLIYEQDVTQTEHKFKRIDNDTYKREDGKLFSRKHVIEFYTYRRQYRSNQEWTITPNGFKVRKLKSKEERRDARRPAAAV